MADELTRRPVLIVGAPRSGTTWVASVLSQVCGARLVHEPDNDLVNPFALRAKAGLGRYPVIAAGDVARDYERLWASAFDPGVRGVSPRDLTARGVLRFTSVNWADRIVEGDTRPGTRALKAVFDQLAVPRGRVGPPADVPMVKSVHSAFALDFITSRWQPSVVVVFRDPLNAIASWLELGFKPRHFEADRRVRRQVIDRLGLPLPRTDDEVTSVAYTYLVLSASLRASVAAHSGWSTVVHEDLCADPQAGFAKLLAELGLPFSAAVEQRIRGSNRPGSGYQTNRVASLQPDRWRQRLSASQAYRIMAIAGEFGRHPAPHDVGVGSGA
ncbi:MAG: sulfotransferase [Streptosporangiaceae bacterium]